jgi:hypothetical protein
MILEFSFFFRGEHACGASGVSFRATINDQSILRPTIRIWPFPGLFHFPHSNYLRSSCPWFQAFCTSATITMDLKSVLDGPAMRAPPGEHHNFVNPSNMTITGRAVFSLCLIISVFAVGMRMWTKARLIRKVVLEDCNSYHQLLWKTRTNDFRGLLFSAGTVLHLYHPDPPG